MSKSYSRDIQYGQKILSETGKSAVRVSFSVETLAKMIEVNKELNKTEVE